MFLRYFPQSYRVTTLVRVQNAYYFIAKQFSFSSLSLPSSSAKVSATLVRESCKLIACAHFISGVFFMRDITHFFRSPMRSTISRRSGESWMPSFSIYYITIRKPDASNRIFFIVVNTQHSIVTVRNFEIMKLNSTNATWRFSARN